MNFRFRAWRICLSLGAGLALALAFPEYNVPLLGWVSLAGLLFAVLGAEVSEAALCGFVYGVAFYSLDISWVYTVLRQYGPLPVWQAAGVLTLLIIALSLFIATFSALVAWIAKRSAGLALFAAPFVWVVLELWRTRLPQIAFPWDMLGFVAAHSLAAGAARVADRNLRSIGAGRRVRRASGLGAAADPGARTAESRIGCLGGLHGGARRDGAIRREAGAAGAGDERRTLGAA